MNDESENPDTKKPTKYFLIIAGVVLLVILIFLLFGFRREKPAANTVSYNYFTFEEVGGLWQTNIQLGGQLYEALFRFNPEQVQDVYVSGNFSGFRNQPVYITFDPDSDDEQFKYLALAASELSLHLVRALNVTIEAACTKNITDVCADRAIVTCADADKSVMYLVALSPTQITLGNSCVTLNGEGMELLKSVDRLLFQWYKIIQ